MITTAITLRHFAKIVLLIFSIAIAANTNGQSNADSMRAIFPQEMPVNLHVGDYNPTARFSPTVSTIDLADSILIEYFKNKQSKGISFHQYYRQYLGYLDAGKKYIFVYACCAAPESFTSRLIDVKGGGHCYFRAFVNLEDKTIKNFSYNASR